MPRIRDLGISFIPVTMRPPEIGGGADVGQYGEPNLPLHFAGEPKCENTKQPHCEATKKPCDPTKPPVCVPSNEPLCVPTNICERTRCDPDSQCGHTGQSASAVTLPDDAIAQLRQQLRQHIGGELVN